MEQFDNSIIKAGGNKKIFLKEMGVEYLEDDIALMSQKALYQISGSEVSN